MRRRWPQLVLSMAVVAMAACGAGGGEEREGAQPAPGVTTFEQGAFDELPQPPDSDPYGRRSEKDGIVTRTYRTNGITPVGVIDFYAEALPPKGWVPVEPAFREDTEARADWVRDEWRLEVSAIQVEDRTNPSAPELMVQYSLVLRPR